MMLGRVGASQARVQQKVKNGEKQFFYVYLLFFAASTITYQSNRNLGLSTFITLAVALQFLAFSLLVLKVLQEKSVCGVSAKALTCHACVYVSRLSSTVWLKGYIPTDPTGKWLYQFMDFMSLVMVLVLLYHIYVRYRQTYQEEKDTFEIGYLMSGCFALAVLLHPHLNGRPMFDTLWTFALYVDVFAMMPQLWMVSKTEPGVKMDGLTAHYIAAIAAARGVSLYFWYYGFREFAPKNGSFNLTGWAIMIAHVIQVLLLLDFVFYYVKACVLGSIKAVQTGDFSQPMVTNAAFDL